MPELKGTKTEKNLEEAFAGESMARNKYTFFASKAKKDGYEQIANFFTSTANNEKEHAEIWFKLLHNNGIPDTEENLQIGIDGEHYEWSDMYARMAQEAREEGFIQIGFLFDGVAKIENEHEQRYAALLENIKNGEVFARKEETVWICLNCGHVHRGAAAPKLCPVCSHPQAYFQLQSRDY
ncbi:MAG: rubrerythrin family protein [Clostridiales bacterium]|jgi:rubrerythrin|nr:rubrerythrin family protein [Clostridiales bacterium]